MSVTKFVHDSLTNRWVIIAPGRIARPADNLPSPPRPGDVSCPFEPGTEALNKEVFRIGGEPGDANWKVRVIANKYPITDIHEVIIHSPDHEKDIDELDLEQVKLILSAYRQRFNYYAGQKHCQVLIFNNHDVHAGASINHPHSQLVVVPNDIELETIPREPIENTVMVSSQFTVYCPNFSQWPYEIWLVPKDVSGKIFGEITDGEIADLARLLPKIIAVLVRKFSQAGAMKQKGSETEIPYNYYIYHGNNWYLRIIPRLIHRAGFELGTGLSVNIVDPEMAAKEYREGLASLAEKAERGG